ncbi:hypothetical protein CANCADRAFT_42735 [Tortispora caseinolytica NRRL Y-17796]|uniref:PHD-type domain-containing protein n=1 Tax=Tortispora caseinolytica NRRL Y-17796 TaxID=767744 RepID=A0A1E4TK53_9ASCO|nr:hypothetical protein CANCADRAFT_42735 [Tortispora caseinolytica NRRL Y-17796]
MLEEESCNICYLSLVSPEEQLALTIDKAALPVITSTNSTTPLRTRSKTHAEHQKLAAKVGLLSCNHYFHFQCIMCWANRSSTCPLCRQEFRSISIRDRPDSDEIKCVLVQHRSAPSDDHTSVDDTVTSTDDELAAISWLPCRVCDSNGNDSELLICDECEATYHSSCLGFDTIPQGDWYCPDCMYIISQWQSTNRRARDTHDYNATPFSLRESAGLRYRRHLGPRRAALAALEVISHRHTSSSSAMRSPYMLRSRTSNGRAQTSALTAVPSLLRNETTPPPTDTLQISPEEQQAWGMFEQARTLGSDPALVSPSTTTVAGTSSTSSASSTSSTSPITTRTRRRLPRRSLHNAGESAGNSSLSSTTPELLRVNSSSSPMNYASQESTPTRVSRRVNQMLEEIRSPATSQPIIRYNRALVIDDSSYSSASSSGQTTPPRVSFEQKQEVQSFVRDKLRPLHRQRRLRSREYTAINKTVSRMVYAYMSECGEAEETNWKEYADELLQKYI